VADMEIFDHNSPQGEQHRCERPNTKFGPRRVGRSMSGSDKLHADANPARVGSINDMNDRSANLGGGGANPARHFDHFW